ncbi:MAG: adenylate/guanylate cyclase domain-containing protein [Proteobacteria bacterium]|nr:adenylate/guanylate cyclase domain-containing protein [Pseudomonadota bacterium]
MAPKTTNLALLFADISGSTRLYEILGDVAARTKVSDCLDMLKTVVERHNGIVIKTIGDEIMCTFETAEAAAIAACEMHEILDDDVTEQTAAGPIRIYRW